MFCCSAFTAFIPDLTVGALKLLTDVLTAKDDQQPASAGLAPDDDLEPMTEEEIKQIKGASHSASFVCAVVK